MPRFFRQPRTANIFFPALKPRERTGWRGRWHVVLTWLGPTWRSSPVRRVVQSVCLVLFLYAFFYVCWPYSQQFSATTLSDKEWFPVDTFLLIDPLVGVSTALAGKVLNWTTFTWTAGIVLFCLLVPRAFCGYLCPLGTLIDLFDWLVGRHFRRFHRPHDGSTRPLVDADPVLPARRRARGVCGWRAALGIRFGDSRAHAWPAVYRRSVAVGHAERGEPLAAGGLDVVPVRAPVCRHVPGEPAWQTVLVPLRVSQWRIVVMYQSVPGGATQGCR